MRYCHWEVLLILYQDEKMGHKNISVQFKDSTLRYFLKKQWITVNEDGKVSITDKGIKDAEEITPLYERDMGGSMG